MDGAFPSAAHDGAAATDGARRRQRALRGADLSDLYPASSGGRGGGGGGGGDGGGDGGGVTMAVAVAVAMVVAMTRTK